MNELKCTGYVIDDADCIEQHAHCPKCGSFLPYDFPTDIPFNCKKCETELICLPDHDEETHEELEWGRICPIKLREARF